MTDGSLACVECDQVARAGIDAHHLRASLQLLQCHAVLQLLQFKFLLS